MKLFPTALLAAAAFVSSTSFALPTRQSEITYFSNATYTQEVGNEIRPGCNGHASPLHGRRTRFAVRVSEACNGGGGQSGAACYVDGVPTTCPASLCDSPIFDCR